jgi:hypothetical protein
MALEDTILNDPTNHQAWINAIEADVNSKYATLTQVQKQAKVAEALQAYLEEVCPKTLQELLTISKNSPADAQVWISILPPARKAQFISEIEAAINTLDPPPPPPPTEPDIRNAVNIMTRFISSASPNNKGGNKGAFEAFLRKYKTHSQLNENPPRSRQTYLEQIIQLLTNNEAKFKPGDYHRLQTQLGSLMVAESVQSTYPVGKEILQSLNLK